MRVGVPTEIKTDEYRVALTPAGARELTARGRRERRPVSREGVGAGRASIEHVGSGQR